MSSCQVEALKGLSLVRLPEVLTLHLKRFVFDWQLNRRIKLNDVVQFDALLDMKPFLHVAEPKGAEEGAEEGAEGAAAAALGAAGELPTGSSAPPGSAASTPGTPPQEEEEEEEEQSTQYELFAILIHAGTAMGGKREPAAVA